jgi:hypothetical protein
MEKIEWSAELPKRLHLRQTGKGIFGCDPGQIDRAKPWGEKSLVDALAVRWDLLDPKKTRRPIPRAPDSLSVSTCPKRTRLENSSPSCTITSTSLAPAASARNMTS